MSHNGKPLFIFELANNHNGSLERGIKIISELKEQINDFTNDFDFAIKLQYRNLETFIHPECEKLGTNNCLKKLGKTKISTEASLILKDEIKKQGFVSICTAFDEDSVDLIEERGFDFIKIASCSFCDWPLLEKIATKNLPIIASTAGVQIEDIQKVVRFFANKNKKLSILHCVAEYPTKKSNLQLNQIDLLKSKFPELTVGYSTHELPDCADSVKIAVAKGARIFEKHVGLDDYEGSINSYSATPIQIKQWLSSAKEAFEICGIEDERYEQTQSEKDRLRNLTRGGFASKDIKKGERVSEQNIFLAIPSQSGQLLPCNLSRYSSFVALCDIKANSPIFMADVEVFDRKNDTISLVCQG